MPSFYFVRHRQPHEPKGQLQFQIFHILQSSSVKLSTVEQPASCTNTFLSTFTSIYITRHLTRMCENSQCPHTSPSRDLSDRTFQSRGYPGVDSGWLSPLCLEAPRSSRRTALTRAGCEQCLLNICLTSTRSGCIQDGSLLLSHLLSPAPVHHVTVEYTLDALVSGHRPCFQGSFAARCDHVEMYAEIICAHYRSCH